MIDNKDIKLVILAGGLGSRLSEETQTIPKPLVEIGGQPIIWHIMSYYSYYGINNFIICCGYKGHLIKDYFANYFIRNSDVTIDLENDKVEIHKKTSVDWKVTLVDTGLETLTAGRVKRIEKFLVDDEIFCLTYGDGLSNVNIDKLIKFHIEKRKTVTLTAVKKPGSVTLPVVQSLVDDILLVSERELEWSVGALIEQQRIVAEGAGAAGIAAILSNPSLFSGKKIGTVICGGNIDPRLLASILNRNMAVDGRIARLRIDISDEPGMLAAITASIGKCGGNIVEIYHQRLFYDVPAKLAKIDAVIETRGPDHVDEIIESLRAAEFQVRQMEDSAC